MSNIQGLYYPFSIIQGETFNFSFDMTISDVEQYFDEYDFVGRVIEPENALIVIANMEFSENDESSSVIDVTIPSNITNNITEGNYLYEIKCTNKETNDVRTVFYGTFNTKRTMIINANPFGI